jgi:hypothetical protein
MFYCGLHIAGCIHACSETVPMNAHAVCQQLAARHGGAQGMGIRRLYHLGEAENGPE